MNKAVSQKKPISEGKLERRQRLIESTITAVARYGLNHVTLDKVAKLAGLVAGTVNFHFNGKEELLLESARYLGDIFLSNLQLALAQADADPARALQSIADIHIDAQLAAQDKVLAWYSFWAETNESDEYRKICNAVDQEYLKAYSQICEKLFLQAGKPIHTLQIQALARGIAGVMNQIWEDLINDSSQESRDQAKLIYQAFFASIFPWAFSLPATSATAAHIAHAALPAWSFTHEALTPLEITLLFKHTWQHVPLKHIPQKKGEYVTTTVLSDPLLIAQGAAGIRAFYNTCRHHPHPIFEHNQHGHFKNTLQCETFGWQYDDEGRLCQWPENLTLTLLEKEQLNLTSLPVQTIKNTVWVKLSDSSQYTLPDIVIEKLESINTGKVVELTHHAVAANWKTVLDVLLSTQRPTAVSDVQITNECKVLLRDVASVDIRLHKQNATRWLLMPNQLITWVGSGYYMVSIWPVDALHTNVWVSCANVALDVINTLHHELTQLLALAEQAQTARMSQSAAPEFIAQNDTMRKIWQTWLQEQLPRLCLSSAPQQLNIIN